MAQKRGGVEQYYYGGEPGMSAIVPKIYYQNKKNWYAELRYNYEEIESISLNIGKAFSAQRQVSYTVTPIAGIITGRLTGVSLGLNAEAEYKSVFFSAESQYTFSSAGKDGYFFYNWSELGYALTDNLYGGFALQLTRLYKTSNAWEPGIMAGVIFNNWIFPVYMFNPLDKNRYFVLGINIEWGK